jgi:hypothetical protein
MLMGPSRNVARHEERIEKVTRYCQCASAQS